jgi:ABC-2 type transport system permease protein
MSPYVFQSTFKDILRPLRVLVWVVVAVLLGMVCWLWVTMSRQPVGLEEYGMLVRMVVYRLVALSAAMFTVSVISQEIEQKTIVYLVTRTTSRASMIVSRGLAAALAVTLTSWIPLVGVALIMLGTGFVGEKVFWMDMVIVALGALAYTALFTFITLIRTKAMLIILLFAFLWETVVPNLQGDMEVFSVNTYMTTLANHPGKDQVLQMSAIQGDPTVIAPWVAWLVLIALAGGMFWLCGWWFSRFQYLPKEDAE